MSLYTTYGSNYYIYALNLQGDVMAILNEAGVAVVEYTYDAWGNILSCTGSMASTLGQLNPLRYRGYVYDNETQLYYLQSRYYDPEIGRFINADAYASTGQGILGNNMYAYCGNNPVMWTDASGTARTPYGGGIPSGYSSGRPSGITSADVVWPKNWNEVAGVGMIGAGIAMTLIASDIRVESIAIRKAQAREKAVAIPTSPPSSTIIYRHGGTNPGNLTPKPKDKYSGLSFSTIPKPGAAMTTIDALNATGVVLAVQDGVTHVSVTPVGATMDDWINAGPSSIWTQAVKSVVIKWDGGY